MEKSRIFYVNDLEGNDHNEGTAPERAWKSLAKVNAQQFRPGDRIRFRRGGVWTGMLQPRGDGDLEAPVVLEGYGQGDKPWIQGNGRLAAIFLQGVSFYRVEGFKLTNHADERAIRHGVCIMGKPEGITQGITVTGCEICDVTGENRRSMGPYRAMYWNGGVYVSFPGRTSTQDHLHDIVIAENDIHDVLTSGIRVNQQEDSINDIHHTHVVIRRNRIQRTGSDGIIVANCISPLIDGNTCYDAGALGNLEETRLVAGIWVCATRDALIQHNEVARTRLFEADGTAFDTDWGTAGDTIFQYNYTHDNEGGFWLDCIGLNRNRECGRTIMRYNIVLDEHRCITQDDYGLPSEFYGNYFGGQGAVPDLCCLQDGRSHSFQENVFDYPQGPEEGWKESHYQGNWYGALEELPEDPQARRGLPFAMPPREGAAPEGMAWCRRVWSQLAGLVKARGAEQD